MPSLKEKFKTILRIILELKACKKHMLITQNYPIIKDAVMILKK